MKTMRFIIPLLLGIAGGFLAFWIMEKSTGSKERATIQHEIVGPNLTKQVVQSSISDTQNNSGTSTAGNTDLRYAAKKTVQAVVNVKTVQIGRAYTGNPLLEYWFGNQPQTREVPRSIGIGSGVIISSDGYLITNNHVIDGSDQIVVTLNDKREFDAKIIGRDRNTDIALLKIEAQNLPFLEYGNSDDVELGEWVLAVGNPYNLNSTVTAGIISAKARELGGQIDLESFLQTDAAVNMGNSGGALVNAKGELIGINTAIQSPTGNYSGYAFAVPVNIARKIVSDLKEFGKVQRAVLGIRMGELTPTLAKKLGISETSGIYVGEVITGSAAQKAGIQTGDVIQRLNNTEVKTVPEFHEQLVKYNPGNTIPITLKRNGKEKTVRVELQNTYGETTLEEKDNFGILGAIVEPLGKIDRERYNLNKGVKIKEIRNGKFKAAGLSEGYIIVRVNNSFIYDSDDLKKALLSTNDDGVFVTAVNPKGRVEYFAFSLQ